MAGSVCRNRALRNARAPRSHDLMVALASVPAQPSAGYSWGFGKGAGAENPPLKVSDQGPE